MTFWDWYGLWLLPVWFSPVLAIMLVHWLKGRRS